MDTRYPTGIAQPVYPPNRDLARWLPLFNELVTAGGVAILLFSFLTPPTDQLGLLVFCAMAAFAEWNSVELFQARQNGSLTLSSLVALASVFTFGPAGGAVTHMFAGLMTALVPSQQTESANPGWPVRMERGAFSIGMYVIPTFLAGWVFIWAGGRVGDMLDWRNIFPAIAAGIVQMLGKQTILAGRKAFLSCSPLVATLRIHFNQMILTSSAGMLVGGAALTLAYQMFNLLGLLVFFLPILATSYSFRMYVTHSRVYVNKLEHMNHDLDDANLGLLETLGAVIDAYDMYTYGHSTQVAVYASAIASKMNLEAEIKTRIVKAALVHDLGKIGIDDSIISKKEKLEEIEYNLLKRHPAIGAEIISRMKGLQDIVPLVRHHHERWDGKGYPDGLAGEEIPLGARILGLADALDAMFSDRPYRPTRSYKEVMSEVAKCSGSHFDPAVVEVFFQVAEEMGRSFFKNSAAVVDRAMQVEGVPILGRLQRHLKRSMLPE